MHSGQNSVKNQLLSCRAIMSVRNKTSDQASLDCVLSDLQPVGQFLDCRCPSMHLCAPGQTAGPYMDF